MNAIFPVSEEAETEAKRIFGDKWPLFKEAIVNSNAEGLGKAIADTYKSDGKHESSPEESVALYDYASSYYTLKALNDVTPESVTYVSEDLEEARNSFTKGMEAAGEELQSVFLEANRLESEVARLATRPTTVPEMLNALSKL